MPVIDASLCVSLFHARDRHHARAVAWLERVLGEGASLVAPNLLVVELSAAIRRLSRDGNLAAAAVSELEELAIVELLPFTSERARQAAVLAAATGVRGADAVYLSLARERGDVLLTLDRQQLERGASVVPVERP